MFNPRDIPKPVRARLNRIDFAKRGLLGTQPRPPLEKIVDKYIDKSIAPLAADLGLQTDDGGQSFRSIGHEPQRLTDDVARLRRQDRVVMAIVAAVVVVIGVFLVLALRQIGVA
jgi:hypothetical protein